MTTARLRLLALPLLATLIVAVAMGAAARSSTSAAGRANPQVSVDASSVLVTLFGIAVLAGAAYVISVFLTARRPSGQDKERTPFPLRTQLIVLAGTLGALALVVLLVFVTLGPKTNHGEPLAGPTRGTAAYPKVHVIPYSAGAGAATAATVLALVGAALAIAYWRRRRRRHGAKPFLTELLAREVESPPIPDLDFAGSLAGLSIADPRSEPDARKAVIAAWMAMTDVIGRHWRDRYESEAPREYLELALAGAGVGRASAGRLTTLFESARWSERPVGEEMRFDAVAALEAVRDELQAAS
jgi:NADH:ubiquinone oxidoreductase subunit 6 (subunit J)